MRFIENTKRGYIGLYRSMTEHWLYPKGKFTKYEAWIDILLMVNYKDNPAFNGERAEMCKRGETFTSQKKLMKRWGWSKSKLILFLKVLETEQMLNVKTTSKKTTLKVLKYDEYQDFEGIEKMKKDHKKTVERLQKDLKKTAERLQKATNNKDNNIKNDNKKENRFVFRKELINLGFEKDLVDDWLKVRKNKKATNSETVLKSIEKQIANTKIDKNDILRMHVLKSWAGFKVVWYINETTKSNTVTKPRFQNDRL